MFKLRRNTCDETFVRLTINYELAAFDRYTRDVNQFNFLSAVAGSKRRKGCDHPRNGPCCRRDIFFSFFICDEKAHWKRRHATLGYDETKLPWT